ncbi:hypothetical protein [Candidatus Poriferisodalis sp.]|uniref:hypothetical protein n=1 Tax=Candidatus Poriferisodalis sp. TaxID=3101277 RepID=UPI003B5205AB
MSRREVAQDQGEDQLRADQLAACHALLDSFRRGNRQDVLVSTLVATLARRGGLTSQRLFAAIKQMWRTSAIADAVLARALVDARAGGLVTLQEDLEGNETFVVSAEARDEAELDQQYVAFLLHQFTLDIAERLSEYEDATRLLPKTERIVNFITTAIARACEGSYAIDSPSPSAWARPDHINTQPIRSFASTLQPKSIREPVTQLALDALDPTDSFGNQIVHLVVVSNLLHGLAAQRGLGATPSLQQVRLLLDTSALVNLASPSDDPGHRLILELATLSRACGATVIVAEHTLEEWERVWEAADLEEIGQRNRANRGLSPREARLIGNPFLAAYTTYRHSGGTDSWTRWQSSRRNIRQQLKTLGVLVQRHDNSSTEDRENYELVHDKLVELSEDKNTRATRSGTAASADAHSAAMIARWRRENGDQSALMLAHDRLTNQAYSEMFADEAPLVGEPGAWLLYVSNLIADDPAEVVDVAEFVADLAVRNTLLEIASNYSLEEALDISEILVQGPNGLSAREARDLNDPTLFDALDALQKESGEDARTRAAAVLQRRATRNNRRAAFRESIQNSELESVKGEADELVERETNRTKHYAEDAAAQRHRAVAAEAKQNSLEKANTRLRRLLIALGALGVGLAPLLVLATLGLLGFAQTLVVILGMCALGAYAWAWIDNPETPSARIWIGTLAQLVLSVFFALIS